MKRNKEKALMEKAVKMRKEGEDLFVIQHYLNQNSPEEDWVSEAMEKLKNMEAENQFYVMENQHRKSKIRNTIVGMLLIIVAFVLFSFLWDKGILAGIPVILAGTGLLTFTGVIE